MTASVYIKSTSKVLCRLLMALACLYMAHAGSLPSDLIGTWGDTSTGLTQFVNPATGSFNSGASSGTSYVFTPDGCFDEAGMMTSELYGCSTKVFAYQHGAVDAQGNQLTFQPLRDGTIETQQNCPARSSKKQYYNPGTYTYSIRDEVDQYTGQTYTYLYLADGAGKSYKYQFRSRDYSSAAGCSATGLLGGSSTGSVALSAGEIAGIVVGTVFGIPLLAVAGLSIYKAFNPAALPWLPLSISTHKHVTKPAATAPCSKAPVAAASGGAAGANAATAPVGVIVCIKEAEP